MAFWNKWFGSSGESASPGKTLEYNGYSIMATPYKAGAGWQLAGEISKDGKSHRFVRADNFSSREEAEDYALQKGKLIVDQLGMAMFKA